MSEIETATQPRRATAYELIEGMRPQFERALPAELPADRFLRLALNELRVSPQLAQCSASSLLGALMRAAQLGLEPGGPLGHFWLTPRRLKDQGWAVVPVVGYRGLITLAYRSGQVADIDAVLIREGDIYREGASKERGHWFEWEPLIVDGDDYDETARPVVGVLAMARLTTGGSLFKRLKLREIEARKNRGSAGDKGPWSTDYEAMVLKTGVRALAPLVPQSSAGSAFVQATRIDEQVQTYTKADDPEWSTPAQDDGR